MHDNALVWQAVLICRYVQSALTTAAGYQSGPNAYVMAGNGGAQGNIYAAPAMAGAPMVAFVPFPPVFSAV